VDNEDEGARLTQREANRELIAKHRAEVEPRGCPTPGSCSAVAEIADLKQRLLPQANGRAERAEKARQMAVVERDAILEELIVHRTAIANLHDVIDGMRGAAPSATAVAWCVAYDDPRMGRIHSDATMNKLQAEELAARRGLALVPLYAAPQAEAGATDRPDWAQQLPGAEIFDRSNDAKDAVRYRWIREQYYYPPGTLLDQAIDAAIRERNK